MLKILNQRERRVFVFTAGVIIFSLVFNFALMPLFTKYKDLNEQIKIAKNRLVKYSQLMSQKDKIQSRFDQLSGADKLIGKQKNNLVEVLGELDNLAKEANIRLIDLRPQQSKKEITVEVRSEGRLEDYLRFIYSVENSLYILNIKRLQLNSRPNSADLEASFTVIQNYLK